MPQLTVAFTLRTVPKGSKCKILKQFIDQHDTSTFIRKGERLHTWWQERVPFREPIIIIPCPQCSNHFRVPLGNRLWLCRCQGLHIPPREKYDTRVAGQGFSILNEIEIRSMQSDIKKISYTFFDFPL